MGSYVRFWLELGLVVGLLLPAGEAWAQGPRGGELGRFEVFGMDFRPDGAWRNKVSRIREARRLLLRSGNLLSLNRAAEGARRGEPRLQVLGEAQAVSGTIFVPVVLIAYSNIPAAFPIADFQQVLFTPDPSTLGRPYSLKTYYEEVSNGLIHLEGRVFEPVRMDTTNTYYEDGCNGVGVVNSCPNNGTRFGQMLIRALDSVSLRPGGDTTWNQFDNDGPDGLPNSGDDDGVVDFVTFLHPTVDGACGRPGIWSHRFQVRAWNAGSPYVTRTPRRGPGGQPMPGEFIRVDDYTIQSQLGGSTACLDGALMPIGTVAHETGHAFGLPDLYDTEQGVRSQGIGEWGLMGSGNFTTPMSPATYDAWSLVELGWVTVAELDQNGVVETRARQVSDTVFLGRTDVGTEYFLIENRQAVESDTAQMNPSFTKRKAPGLAIWFIDEHVIAVNRPSNRVNTGPTQGVNLLQADGLNQLRTPGSTNRGDTGDSYPGSTSNTRLGFATNPTARNHFNEFAGFLVDRIEPLSGQRMRFRFTRREPSLFRPAIEGPRIRVAGVSTSRFEEVLPAGDAVTLGAEQDQVVNGGRTQARFLSWSNGGPREQQLVSGANPDTITAAFAASHRVLAVTQGGGSLTASVSGNLTQGVFVESGNAVTLTANAPAGSLFAGWQGDTTSTQPTLVLPMQRPYDVTAVFLLEQQIPLDAATDEVLGTTSLTQEQREYLDQLGNRNGQYDVGDYLSLLKRTGVQPSPELLRRLAARRSR